MKIHEYQAKQLLASAGVTVPRGVVAHTADEAADAFRQLAGDLAVVKSQIHAGGRGKGTFKEHPQQHGVVLVKSPEAAKDNATRMLGSTLVTIQTGPEGKVVSTLLIEEGLKIAREFYLGVVVDRESGGPILIASTEGGMEIEVVAHKTPEKILHEPFDVESGLLPYQARNIAYRLGLEGNSVRSAEKLLQQLCKFFVDRDCSMVEINPLVVTAAGDLVVGDAKVTFDDNALFRLKDLLPLRDLNEEEPMEVQAQASGLSYVKLDGNLGCLVNGAGLAMSTMDIIKYHGGAPANFLDVGGGANVEQVTEAFRIILADPNVKGILVNIFGGIMKCDTIVTALLAAYDKIGIKVPLVVRLEGTNVDLARKMLADSGKPILVGTDLTDAAQKAVKSLGA
jgi:succinyl-CoA synthetase beta subunit